MRPNAILDLLHIPWGTKVYSGLNEDSISSSEMKMYFNISFSRTIIWLESSHLKLIVCQEEH